MERLINYLSPIFSHFILMWKLTKCKKSFTGILDHRNTANKNTEQAIINNVQPIVVWKIHTFDWKAWLSPLPLPCNGTYPFSNVLLSQNPQNNMSNWPNIVTVSRYLRFAWHDQNISNIYPTFYGVFKFMFSNLHSLEHLLTV